MPFTPVTVTFDFEGGGNGQVVAQVSHQLEDGQGNTVPDRPFTALVADGRGSIGLWALDDTTTSPPAANTWWTLTATLDGAQLHQRRVALSAGQAPTVDYSELTDLVPPTLVDVVTGPRGLPGPPGTAFVFTQELQTTEWVIAHGLGHYPTVACVDTAGDQVYGSVHHVDTDHLTVTFLASLAGTATLV